MASLNSAFRKGHHGLFPNKNSSDQDAEILQRMESFYRDSESQNENFWVEASIDSRFYSGDKTLWNELYGSRPGFKRQFGFNRIRRIVNMISGYQRKNRKSLIVRPVENGDQETADQFSKVLSWMLRNDGVLETISDGFCGALTSGINLLQLWMDYSNDPVSGDLRVSNAGYNTFIMDPYFKKRDLSDCNTVWKRSYLTKNQIKALMPRSGDSSVVKDLKDDPDTLGKDKFRFMPEEEWNSAFSDRYAKLYAYDEFYYRDTRRQKILRDLETGETTEWTGKNNEDGNARLKQFLEAYPEVKLISSSVQTVKMAVVVDGNVIYNGKNPLGTDTYPFVPIMAYFQPELSDYSSRIQSVVRDLRDSQYLYNRRKNIELEMLEAQVNSGWKYKEDALVDPASVFLSGEGRGIALKNSAQMSDVEKIVPGQIPPSVLELSTSLANEIQQISGVNEELLGSATDDKAGILSQLRQGAGLTTLQGLFDNLDYSMKIFGRIAISVIQNNFSTGKVQKIIEEQPLPQFYNKAFGKYDAAIEEGVNTTTQKQTQLIQLLHLREIGIPIPDNVVIEALSIQNKSDLLEAINRQKQGMMQAEQDKQSLELELTRAQVQLAEARAAADIGLAQERMSRIPENRAMAIANIAEANKDDEQAMLNKTKAMAELEDMDLAQLNKLLFLSKALRASEEQDKAVLALKAGVIR